MIIRSRAETRRSLTLDPRSSWCDHGKRKWVHMFPFKSGLLTGLLLFIASLGWAQDDAQMEKNYQEKQKKPFVKKIEWVTTLAEAREISEKKGLPILAYFTRSYAP